MRYPEIKRPLLFILGTRPEITKLYSTIQACEAEGVLFQIAHTGQHYDFEMSEVFFEELHIPTPDYFLEIGSGTHAEQTAEMLRRLEKLIAASDPHCVLAVGDTNTVLSAALTCSKLHIPFVHVEAGVRSYDMTMPEEINRRVADCVATICMAPTTRAQQQLILEGRGPSTYLVGDTLNEVSRPIAEIACQKSNILDIFGLMPDAYAVLTLHRSENVDDKQRLEEIVSALEQLDFPVIYPMHPRTRKMLAEFGLSERAEACLTISDPLGYLDFQALIAQSRLVLTDSGGVQQEASILHVPCITLRYNTEWVETVEAGQNYLVGTQTERIVSTARKIWDQPDVRLEMRRAVSPFQPGAAQRILELVCGDNCQARLRIPQSNFLREGLPQLQNPGK